MRNGYVGFTDNFRTSYRGIRQHPSGRFQINMTDNETQNYDFNLAGIMDTGETISSAVVTKQGADFTETVTTSSQSVNLKLASATATGNAYLLLTLSNGNIKQIELYINVTNLNQFEDYN